ncbi:MAG TPA: hypothetical protein VGL89_17100 [Candidatus Koribacter sp.]|jgi:hypothetical protein
MNSLGEWQNFYVIVGSSAGALIGLQFVLITLIAQIPVSGSAEAGNAFATPTIIHFGSVLLLAGIAAAPWKAVGPLAIAWGVVGGFGVVYSLIVVMRVRRQNAYKPEFEDWLFHAWLPLLAYLTVAVSAVEFRSFMQGAFFAVAGAAMLLMFVGIHNAWDAATYHVFVVNRRKQKERTRVDGAA